MENTASILHAKEILLLLGLILGVGTASGFLARLIKTPDVVLFLVAGMLLGGAGFVVRRGHRFHRSCHLGTGL